MVPRLTPSPGSVPLLALGPSPVDGVEARPGNGTEAKTCDGAEAGNGAKTNKPRLTTTDGQGGYDRMVWQI